MKNLGPDIADFRVLKAGDITLAAAFSANDPESTDHLFSLLGWSCAETSILYSDRPDRPARRRGFAQFLGRGWREVRVLKSREERAAVTEWLRGRLVFGCGSVAGFPLEIIGRLLEGGCEWTIPCL
jgi:hypothetical protein